MGKLSMLLSGAPRDILLNKGRTSIGRRSHNDICLDDPAVSGEHAVILRHGEDAVIEDLDSTNGTRVNGQPVKKHFLQDGDVIEVAMYRMAYHAVSGAAPQRDRGVPMLEVTGGRNAGTRTVLSKAITVIGSTEQPGLLVVRRGADFILIEENGASHARVNGHILGNDGWRLRHRDVIQLPDAVLLFFYPSA